MSDVAVDEDVVEVAEEEDEDAECLETPTATPLGGVVVGGTTSKLALRDLPLVKADPLAPRPIRPNNVVAEFHNPATAFSLLGGVAARPSRASRVAVYAAEAVRRRSKLKLLRRGTESSCGGVGGARTAVAVAMAVPGREDGVRTRRFGCEIPLPPRSRNRRSAEVGRGVMVDARSSTGVAISATPPLAREFAKPVQTESGLTPFC